ncbi:SRPBCC family protein [uncultured Nitratireductor sp.]|uniref:SRPBCC family protein n=1 Tax=uncultured Nitratireductor sp. TaxID=520953 RepID=UPI0025D0B1B6|nr:SRPBCC family protein [uncultured Nitratireductor sp.]
MSTTIDVAPISENELVLARIIDAPREKIFRAWTDPNILKQWFVPKPWTIAKAEIDVRPGGSSLIVMKDPDGNEYPNRGVFLEVVENEKIVTTDAFTEAWKPSGKPFMTMILTLEDAGEDKTRYIARALHWNAEDVEAHKKMGFHEGWGQCADQLEEIAAKL